MSENIQPQTNKHSVKILKKNKKTIHRVITYGVLLIVGFLIFFLIGKSKF